MSDAAGPPLSDRGTARLEVLDSIRGIAAMVVVIHHCLLTQPAFSDFFFSNWTTQPATFTETLLFKTPLRIVWDGFEAVTLFYVLSGLVLALPWVRGRPPTYSVYAIKRICRIYLPYLAAIAAAAFLSGIPLFTAPIVGLSDWVNTMNWSHPVTAWVLADHVLMIGHYNNLNGVIHSLIWEMRVSLMFPLLVLPIVRWRIGGALAVTALITVLIVAIQLMYAVPGSGLELLGSRPDLGGIGKLALELQWTAYFSYFFVLGTLIALYLPRINGFMGRLAGWQSIAVLVVGLLVFQGHWSHAFTVQQIMVALGSTLIIMVALGTGIVPNFLRHRVFIFLGRISYSLYLVHVPLLMAAVLLLDGKVPLVVTLVLTPFVATAVAYVFDVLIARPSVTLGKRLAGLVERPSRPTPLPPAASLVNAPEASA